MTDRDEVLRNLIIAELDFDPSIESTGIVVAADNGVVTLSGHVPTAAQKLAARDAVARVRGVRAIAQELEVRHPHDPHDDQDLAGRAANVLEWASVLPREAIQVEVSSGVVTLTGEVEWDYQRRIADQLVRGLSGVLDLNNEITLAHAEAGDDVKAQIEEALRRNAFDGSDINVWAEGGVVALTGSVGSWYDCDRAERLAWSVGGVRSVENRLAVVEGDKPAAG